MSYQKLFGSLISVVIRNFSLLFLPAVVGVGSRSVSGIGEESLDRDRLNPVSFVGISSLS